jgi:hypothetical protein
MCREFVTASAIARDTLPGPLVRPRYGAALPLEEN